MYKDPKHEAERKSWMKRDHSAIKAELTRSHKISDFRGVSKSQLVHQIMLDKYGRKRLLGEGIVSHSYDKKKVVVLGKNPRSGKVGTVRHTEKIGVATTSGVGTITRHYVTFGKDDYGYYRTKNIRLHEDVEMNEGELMTFGEYLEKSLAE
jgi:hypothetical protein